jgi:hypothetical protein
VVEAHCLRLEEDLAAAPTYVQTVRCYHAIRRWQRSVVDALPVRTALQCNVFFCFRFCFMTEHVHKYNVFTVRLQAKTHVLNVMCSL